MAPGPTGIGSDLVSVRATPFVKFYQALVVHDLYSFLIGILVVELFDPSFNIIYHVGAHRRVMSVRIYFWTEEHFHEGIAEANTH